MKPENKNYYCIVNCGIFDSSKNNVKDDKPLSVSLLSSHINKSKNEIDKSKEIKTVMVVKKGRHTLIHKDKIRLKPLGIWIKKKGRLSTKSEIITVSPCTKLKKQTTREDYEENYAYYDDEHKFI
jgi:hypothetical protein